MSQAAQGTPAPAQAPAVATALIAGRIEAARAVKQRDGQRLHLTLVKLPAPDEFTSPQTIEVRSHSRLGDAGETWRGKVRLGGFGRSYAVTDQETGERRTVRTADNSLTVVE